MRARQETINENHTIYIYRGKPRRFIPKKFTSKKEVPKDIIHVTIHPWVHKIHSSVFRDCEDLLSATIPKTVKSIGKSAFRHCQSLTSLHFHHPGAGSRLRTINCFAFSNTSLVMVNFPLGLKTIGDYSFGGCKSLRIVTMPGTLKTIGDSAFLGCINLAHVDFLAEAGLELINSFAFSDCTALSGITLPLSLERIACRAFFNCHRLLGVEFLEGTKVKLGSDCFYRCRSLANVSIPDSISDVASNAFVQCDCLGDSEVISRLRNRFSDLPVHKFCYSSSSAGSTLDDMIQILATSTMMLDEFGMNLFHIVVTSPKPRLDFLECLLERFPMQFLGDKDNCGKTMMDYLLMRTSSKAVPLIQLVLRRAIIDTISSWAQGTNWESELSALVESIPYEDGTDTRRFRVSVFYKKAGYYVMVETTSLLELAIWKLRLKTAKKQESETARGYRTACRCQCGAGVVIENVLGFLLDRQTASEAAKSVFPLFHAVDPEIDLIFMG